MLLGAGQDDQLSCGYKVRWTGRLPLGSLVVRLCRFGTISKRLFPMCRAEAEPEIADVTVRTLFPHLSDADEAWGSTL